MVIERIWLELRSAGPSRMILRDFERWPVSSPGPCLESQRLRADDRGNLP